MKIAVCSDLHLEFGDIDLENTENAEVLILSGDICVARDIVARDEHGIVERATSDRYHQFFWNCCDRFPHVVYVLGNHEHYHGDFTTTVSRLKNAFKYIPNLIILDNESWTMFGETTFIGGTLWTDMNKEDSLTLFHMKSMMNDFRVVNNSHRTVTRRVPIYKKDENGKYIMQKNGEIYSYVEDGFKFKEEVALFSPENAVDEHKKMVEYIRLMTEGKFDHKFVVVGHHAPSKLSTHPRYADETIMNGGYSSDLSEFILDHPQIKLWTHGHTHEPFDYMIGETRIVCNPRGYHNYEESAYNFQLKFVEI